MTNQAAQTMLDIESIVRQAINEHCPNGKWLTGTNTLAMAITSDVTAALSQTVGVALESKPFGHAMFNTKGACVGFRQNTGFGYNFTVADFLRADKIMPHGAPHTGCLVYAAAPAASGGEAWRCFYCDEVFTDRESAHLHFGAGNFLDQKTPGCQIDIAAYRAMEETVRRYQEEDADIHRAMHRMAGEHALALRREEEKGYARGLRDAENEPQPPSAASVSERARELPESLRTEIFNAFDDITGLCRYLREGGPVDDDLNGLNEGLQEAIHIAGGMMARMSEPVCEPSPDDVKRHARELLAQAERGPQNDYGTVHRQIAHRAIEQALTLQREDDVAPGDGHAWGDFSRKDLCELADRLTEEANLRITRKWPFLKSPGAIANAIDAATRHYPLVGAIRNVLIETDQIYVVPDTTPQPSAEALREAVDALQLFRGAKAWIAADAYDGVEVRARELLEQADEAAKRVLESLLARGGK